MTIKLGITGSIGMGKTTVSLIFKTNGIKVWNADREVHKLYKKGHEGYNKITSIYPQLKDKIEINREKLSYLIKQKKVELKKIEKEIHPILKNSRLRFIRENKEENIIVFEIPLLYETGANEWLDYVISVYCSYETQIKRLSKRKNFDMKKINYLISKQLPVKQKNKRADFLINTDLDKKEVEIEVINIIKTLEKIDG